MFNVLQLRKIFGPLVKAAPPKPKPRPTFKPHLEALEERWCPAPATDTLVWAPTNGIDASKKENWFDETQNTQSVTAPTATNPIVLDGTKSSAAIEFTAATPVASITVRGAYNGTFLMDAEATVTTTANDTINSGCILTIVSKSADSGIVLANDATFTVAAGGILNLSDQMGATEGVTFLTESGLNSYLNNAGTVNWNGTSVAAGSPAVQDLLKVPVLNSGTFNADGGTRGQTNVVPGQLAIYDSTADTDKASFDQTSGSFNLKNGAYVATQFGYYQTGGSLTSDSSTGSVACTLVGSLSGNAGDIAIEGGKVVVDNVANTIGSLKFSANTVEINGEIDVDGLTMMGGRSTASDLLDLTQVNRVSLYANSYLNVGTTGTSQLGTGNQWTVMTYKLNALQGSWTQLSYPAGMTVSTGAMKVLVSN